MNLADLHELSADQNPTGPELPNCSFISFWVGCG